MAKTIKLKVFNIKLISENRKGTSAYVELFESIQKKDPRVMISKDKAIEFRRFYINDDKTIFFGRLIKYQVLDTENWYNRKKDLLQTYEVEEGLFPNSTECEFYFIPEAHRFFFQDNTGFTPSQIASFLEIALHGVIAEDEEVKISIEVSQDVIDKILTAEIVSRLEISVSYTNNDLTEDYEKEIDNDLRNTGVDNIDVVAKSRKKSTLDLLKSKLLRGYLMLSRRNGYAKATIRNGKKREIVETKDYPNRISIEVDGEYPERSIYNKIMKEYRPNKK